MCVGAGVHVFVFARGSAAGAPHALLGGQQHARRLVPTQRMPGCLDAWAAAAGQRRARPALGQATGPGSGSAAGCDVPSIGSLRFLEIPARLAALPVAGLELEQAGDRLH